MSNLAGNYASSIEYDQLHQVQAITIKNTSLKRTYSNDKDKTWVAAPNKKKKKVKFLVNKNSSKGMGLLEPTYEFLEEFKQVI
ncbi:hypothetical protein Pyn_00977 [Prunus yedoensis var. nudiflora]|uniref:Uncharacterized protein n=1 Tax=Prunus yedoensis var. nudiflora TaxID=2094558 RepID=A0A314UG50_PRUYE|nr:hypothetical protein Pyn_00977 [Prunus yedoensis var. nudiflora]